MKLLARYLVLLLSGMTVSSQLFPVYFDPKSGPPPEVEIESSQENKNYITKTVYGFLDFVTTIADTVMVFKPGNGPSESSPAALIDVKSKTSSDDIFAVTSTVAIEGLFVDGKSKTKESKPTKDSSITSISTKVNVVPPKESKKTKENHTKPKKVMIESSQEHYDFLSKEPNLSVEEKEVTIKESILPTKTTSEKVDKKEKPQSHVEVRSEVNAVVDSKVGPKVVNFPVGLVTKIGGTIVQEGLTTVHETKVIGTYIEGKYAQILQSTSHIFKDGIIETTKPPQISTEKSKPLVEDTPPVIVEDTKDIELVKSVIEGTSTRVFSQLASFAPKLSTDAELPLEKLFSVSEAGQKSIETISSSPVKISNSVINTDPIPKDKSPKPVTVSSNLSKKKMNPASSRRNSAQEDFLSRLRSTNQNQREALYEEPDKIVRAEPVPANRNRSPARFSSRKPSKPEVRRYTTSKATSTAYKRPSTASLTTTRTKNPSSNFKNRFRVRYGGPSTPEPEDIEEELDIELDKFTTRVFSSRSSFRRKTEDGLLTTIAPSVRSNLPRPSGRWRYRTTEVPKVSIRSTNTAALSGSEDYDDYEDEFIGDTPYDQIDLEPSSELTKTIRLTTSTAEDDPNKIYEIATIKSVYTFKVGSITNSRFITVTTTMEKSLGNNEEVILIEPTPTLGPEILLTKAPTDEEITEVDNDVAVLPPIGIAGEITEPPLKTVTETYSTNQLMLKTSILPVVYNSNTTYYTLTQSYHVTKMVSALKTIPPSDAYQFVPTDNFNDLNAQLQEAGSEHREHLLLDDEDEPPNQKILPYPDFILENEDLSSFGGNFTADSIESILRPQNKPSVKEPVIRPTPVIKTPDETVVSDNQLDSQPAANSVQQQQQQLALLGLYNPYLAANLGLNAATAPKTSHKPVFETKTLYETNVLPIFDGHKTFMTTLIREAGVTTITKEEVVTLQPSEIAPQLPLVPGFPNPFNPFGGPAVQTVSSQITLETTLTRTSTKIYKLHFGPRTLYSTVTSYTPYLTTLVKYTTSTIPVQNPAIPFGFPFLG